MRTVNTATANRRLGRQSLPVALLQPMVADSDRDGASAKLEQLFSGGQRLVPAPVAPGRTQIYAGCWLPAGQGKPEGTAAASSEPRAGRLKLPQSSRRNAQHLRVTAHVGETEMPLRIKCRFPTLQKWSLDLV